MGSRRLPDLCPHQVDRGLLVLLGWMILRTLIRPEPFAEGSVLMTWLLPIAAFRFGTRLSFETANRTLAWALVAMALLQGALMIVQYLGLDPIFPDTTRPMGTPQARMIGTIGYHNQAADVVALGAAGLFVLTRGPWIRLFAMLPLVVVVLLTGSRAAIVGLMTATVIAHLRPFAMTGRSERFRRRLLPSALGVAVMISLIGLMPGTRDRFEQIVEQRADAPSLASRLWMYRISLDLWGEKPWVGHGAGEYARQYTDRLGLIVPEHKTHSLLRTLVHAREAHQDYLQFLAEFGVLGAILLLYPAILVMRVWWRQERDPWHCDAGLFVLVYMLISGSLSFTWQTAMAGPLAGLVLGMVSVQPGGMDARRQTRPRSWTLLAWTAIAAMLLVWSLVEVRWNTSLPVALERGDAQRVADKLPPWGHRHLALVGGSLAGDGKWEDAESVLREAGKGYVDAVWLNNLGHVLAHQGRWQEACEIYALWAASGISHQSALDNLSVAFEQIGQPGQAARILRQRLELWPEHIDPAPVTRLAGLYYLAGQPETTLWVLETFRTSQGVTVDMLSAEALNLMGACHRTAGRNEEARQWFAEALARNPGLNSARRNLEQLEAQDAPPHAE